MTFITQQISLSKSLSCIFVEKFLEIAFNLLESYVNEKNMTNECEKKRNCDCYGDSKHNTIFIINLFPSIFTLRTYIVENLPNVFSVFVIQFREYHWYSYSDLQPLSQIFSTCNDIYLDEMGHVIYVKNFFQLVFLYSARDSCCGPRFQCKLESFRKNLFLCKK